MEHGACVCFFLQFVLKRLILAIHFRLELEKERERERPEKYKNRILIKSHIRHASTRVEQGRAEKGEQ